MYTTLIDCDTLAENLDNSDWVIVDCRYDLMDANVGQKAWLESHVPGAVYASVSHDLSGPPITDRGRHPMPGPEAMIESFSSLGIGPKKQVVVYDDASGSFAARLWWMLRYMRHDNVAVLDGGWPEWQRADRPVRSGAEQNVRISFSGKPRLDRLVIIEQVPEVELLIDSRDPDRFQGKLEPIDRAAGHIPGAVNYFWRNNLAASDRFLDPAQLAENLITILGEVRPEDAVFYCGSGVTACHNILASAHAGLSEPRLYGGSWSEWCADPDRPVATGK